MAPFSTPGSPHCSQKTPKHKAAQVIPLFLVSKDGSQHVVELGSFLSRSKPVQQPLQGPRTTSCDLQPSLVCKADCAPFPILHPGSALGRLGSVVVRSSRDHHWRVPRDPDTQPASESIRERGEERERRGREERELRRDFATRLAARRRGAKGQSSGSMARTKQTARRSAGGLGLGNNRPKWPKTDEDDAEESPHELEATDAVLTPELARLVWLHGGQRCQMFAMLARLSKVVLCCCVVLCSVV
jgi:hypothetical protein